MCLWESFLHQVAAEPHSSTPCHHHGPMKEQSTALGPRCLGTGLPPRVGFSGRRSTSMTQTAGRPTAPSELGDGILPAARKTVSQGFSASFLRSPAARREVHFLGRPCGPRGGGGRARLFPPLLQRPAPLGPPVSLLVTHSYISVIWLTPQLQVVYDYFFFFLEGGETSLMP